MHHSLSIANASVKTFEHYLIILSTECREFISISCFIVYMLLQFVQKFSENQYPGYAIAVHMKDKLTSSQ